MWRGWTHEQETSLLTVLTQALGADAVLSGAASPTGTRRTGSPSEPVKTPLAVLRPVAPPRWPARRNWLGSGHAVIPQGGLTGLSAQRCRVQVPWHCHSSA